MGRTEVKVLWVQHQTLSGRVVVEKCEGSRNVSDTGTNPLSATALEQHRDALASSNLVSSGDVPEKWLNG